MSHVDTDVDDVGVDVGGDVEEIGTPKRPRDARPAPVANPSLSSRLASFFEAGNCAGTCICRGCGADGLRSSRTNLYTHLGRCLSDRMTLHSISRPQRNSTTAQDLKQAILRCVAVLNLPLSIVEADAFRDLLATAGRFGPNPPAISSQCIRQMALEGGERCLADVLALVNQLHVFHSLSSDAWTSKNGKSGHVLVMLHVQDDDWNLRTHVLSFLQLNSSHSAEAYVEELRKASEPLINKPIAFLCDSAPTMMAAQRQYFDAVQGPAVLKLPCGIHVLRLSVKHALKKSVCRLVGALKKKCRKVAAQFYQPDLVTEVLRSKCLSMEDVKSLRVMQGNETGWSSTFAMMKRLYELRTPLNGLKSNGRIMWLDENELRSLKRVCAVLEPCVRLTQELQRESARFPDFWWGVKDLISSLEQMDLTTPFAETAAQLRDELVGDISWRLNGGKEPRPKQGKEGRGPGCRKTALDQQQQSDVLLMSYVHPQYFNRLTVEEREVAGKRVVDLVCSLVREFRREAARSVVQGTVKLWEEDFSAAISASGGTLGMDWWIHRGKAYYAIRLVAQGLLSVPASTAGMERLYRADGLVTSHLRNRLDGDVVGALLRLRSKELDKELVLRSVRASRPRRGSLARPEAEPEPKRPVQAVNPP